MAEIEVEKLVIALEARTKQMESALKRVEKLTNDAAGKVERDFERVNRAGAKMSSQISGAVSLINRGLGTLGLGISVAGIANFSRQAVADLGDVADAAERLGVTTDELQAIRFGVKLAGGDFEGADRAIQKFGKNIGTAMADGGELAEVFKLNGVAIRNSNGEMLSAGELLERYAVLVANAENQSAKLALASAAFGEKAGPKMIQTLESIARDGLPAFIEKARESGHVVGNDLIAAADKIDDRWTALFDRLTKKAQSFIVELDDSLRRNNEGEFAINVKGGSRATGSRPLSPQFRTPDEAALEAGREGARGNALAKLERPIFTPTKLPSKAKETTTQNNSADVLQYLRLEREALTLNNEKRREAERLEMQMIMVKRAGADASEKEKAEIRGAVDALFAKKLAFEELKKQVDAYNDAIQFGGDMLVDVLDGLISKTQTWEEALQGVLRMIQRALLQAVILGEGPLAGITGMKSATGNAGGLLGMLFGGLMGRAGGGPTFPRVPTIVGENGPELYVPREAGTVVPNHAMRGSSSPQVVNHWTVHAPGASAEAMAVAFREIRSLQNQVKRMPETITGAKQLRPAAFG